MLALARLILLITISFLAGCNPFDSDSGNNGGSEDASIAGGPDTLSTGLQSMRSNGVERTYYFLDPEPAVATVQSASVQEELKPLIVGFHGSFASHRSWIGDTDRYGLVDQVGDAAIMVFPDALALDANNVNWNFDYDFLFFEDLLAELERRGLKWDPNRVFVVGHSSGAGMASEIGCRYGDFVRAIAVSSGALISGGNCIGSTAVIQTHGEVDTITSFNTGASSIEFWARYNGHDPESQQAGVIAQCIDYSAVAFPNEVYPVQFCQHPGGHPWTAFNAEAYWSFFSGLPTATPTPDAPPGGGNEAGLGDADTTISFTLRYPEGIPPVTSGSITLYNETYEPGQFTAPEVFLNLIWNPNDQAPGGQVQPGTEVTYSLVPITFLVFGGEFDLSREYKLKFSIGVEGGSSPIPTPLVDHDVSLPYKFVDKTLPVILQEPLDVTPVVPW